jgi:hypothetical protein
VSEQKKPLDILAALASQDADCRANRKVVLGCLMAAFEGPAGFARTVKTEFDAAQPGSTVRNKVLTTTLDLMRDCADEDEEFDDDDYEAMQAQVQRGNGTV